MREALKKIGLYWQPLGGNNPDQISGHCYRYTDIRSAGRNGQKSSVSLLVDLGKFDNYQALGVKNATAAVPDIREILADKKNAPQALLLTHSHPDHLNGIIHYLKAGYRLPPVYGGKYTLMILYDLLCEFNIPRRLWPKFHVIKAGDKFTFGSLGVDVVSSSHTCFDSFGFLISSQDVCVYHTGDMKIDQTTCFRKSTDLKMLKQASSKIDYVVADFYGISSDGLAVQERSTYLRLVHLIQSVQKNKIFIPVYPTHPEMYLIAFMAALKCKKNVVFYGNVDFFTYLKMVVDYGLSFENMAKNRIKVSYSHDKEALLPLKDDYVVIGTFNELPDVFEANRKNSFGIITASTFFNPLKGQFNLHNIKFVTVDDYPELQGYGHAFWGDIEKLNQTLEQKACFIPTHCPVFMIDDVRELAQTCDVRLLPQTPQNNQIFRLEKERASLAFSAPAKWLAVVYNSPDSAFFTEVLQKPTSGKGFLKRTISRKRCQKKFKSFMIKRKKRK